MWTIIYGICLIALSFFSPLAGFALLDIFNCIKNNKKFWLPSKIIVVIFFWAVGWTLLYLLSLA